MKFPVRLLIPALAIVLTAGAAALLFSPPAQAQGATPTCLDTTQQTAFDDETDHCVTAIEFVETGPYKVGAEIKVKVSFSAAVGSDTASSSTIQLVVPPSTSTPRSIETANPLSTNRMNSITFTYTVIDTDEEGPVRVATSTLSNDIVGLSDAGDPPLSVLALSPHDAVSGPDQRIDKTAPTISEVAVTSSNLGKTGGTITVTVTFSEDVDVSGSPTVGIMVGEQARTATYSDDSSGMNVVFKYTTDKDDGDSGAVSFPDDAAITGGTITDSAGNEAESRTISDATGSVTVGDHTVAIDSTAPVVKYKAPSSLTVGVRIRTIRPQTTDTDVTYEVTGDVKLPRLLRLDPDTGYITGRPTRETAGPTRLTIRVCDKDVDAAGVADPNCAEVKLTLPTIRESEEETTIDQTPTLPEVPEVDLGDVTVGDAAPSTALQIALAAAGGALLLGGVSLVAVRRRVRR